MDEQKISSIEHAVSSASSALKRKYRTFPVVVLLLLVFLLLCGTGWYGYAHLQARKAAMPVTGAGYQAVFLEGGQVYFGKLELGKKWLILNDVFYLQTSGAGQPAAPSNFQLVKLGSEIYGPEDRIYLSPGKVLYWENIRGDSRVADAIAKFKEGK